MLTSRSVIPFTEILVSLPIGVTANQEIVRFDIALILIGCVQALIFLLQLFVFADQAKKLKQTVESAAEDSKDMKRSVEEARRAADAMQ